MVNQEIAIAISAAFFGMVVGFLAGYAVRAHISYLRHRSKDTWRRPSQSMPIAISTAWLAITPASRTRS
jgi:NhaP-type Na+/H+ or K+/H+ antiporter